MLRNLAAEFARRMALRAVRAADVLIAQARAKNDAADKWADRQLLADGQITWKEYRARRKGRPAYRSLTALQRSRKRRVGAPRGAEAGEGRTDLHPLRPLQGGSP